MGNYMSTVRQLMLRLPSANWEPAVADIDTWVKANWLRLNPQRMQLIWLGSQQQLEKFTVVDIELMSAVATVNRVRPWRHY